MDLGRRPARAVLICHASSMDPARKLATYDDLAALPSDARAEIVNGTGP